MNSPTAEHYGVARDRLFEVYGLGICDHRFKQVLRYVAQGLSEGRIVVMGWQGVNKYVDLVVPREERAKAK